MSVRKKLLNVGGGSRKIGLPPQYAGVEHLLLDIDPAGEPDVLCDARELRTLEPAQFDVVYCSHNLEHYHRHEVPRVLAGFMHVLKPDGYAHIRVPDMQAVMQLAVERKLDLEDVLYESPAGPIMVLDVMYGLGSQIERSGVDFYAHKTGFTQKSLLKLLREAGFANLFCGTGNLEVNALAFKGKPDAQTRTLFSLPAV
jgi:SAM-dependent methyltransferase